MTLSSQFDRRVRRRDLKSTSLGREAWGSSIAAITNLAIGTTQLSNGEYDTFDITITQNEEYDLLVPEVYIAVYIGSVAANNLLFDGSTAVPTGADPSEWNVVGPFYNYQNWNKEKWQAVVSFSITNVSAGASTDVFVYTRAKYFGRARR
jgi:hypothetical protein